jgi:hypothetical protein
MFANREEYLAFRTEWRNDYKTLSADIRKTKKKIKESDHFLGDAAPHQQLLIGLKHQATFMMERITEARDAARAATAAMRAERAA